MSRTWQPGEAPPGVSAVAINDDWQNRDATRRRGLAMPISAAQVDRLPVRAVAVSANANASAAVERARTVLTKACPDAYSPITIAEDLAQNLRLTTAHQQLANVVIITSLPIAGCSLAVSVAAGLNDRKRPFSPLRLAGAPLGVLRRVVALESAVPLVVLDLRMTSRIAVIAIDAVQSRVVADFWRAALGWDQIQPDDTGMTLAPADGVRPMIEIGAMPEAKSAKTGCTWTYAPTDRVPPRSCNACWIWGRGAST